MRPITPAIGAEITGADPDWLARVDDDRLRSLMHRHGVLVLRPTWPLTRAQHVALAHHLGQTSDHPSGEPDAPCVVRIRHGPGAPPSENVWHSDSSFLASPPAGAVLRAVHVPACGGDTLFADMRTVWRRLPPSIQEVLRPLRATHDVGKWLTGEAADQMRARCPPIEHPIVRRHPVDGAELVFVNEAYTTDVVGMDPADGQLVLAFLYRQVANPEVQCRVRWQPGTVVIWDNRSTQHFACGDYLPAERVMERVAFTDRCWPADSFPGAPG